MPGLSVGPDDVLNRQRRARGAASRHPGSSSCKEAGSERPGADPAPDGTCLRRLAPGSCSCRGSWTRGRRRCCRARPCRRTSRRSCLRKSRPPCLPPTPAGCAHPPLVPPPESCSLRHTLCSQCCCQPTPQQRWLGKTWSVPIAADARAAESSQMGASASVKLHIYSVPQSSCHWFSSLQDSIDMTDMQG